MIRCIGGGEVFWPIESDRTIGNPCADRGAGSEWRLHSQGVPQDALHHLVFLLPPLSGLVTYDILAPLLLLISDNYASVKVKIKVCWGFIQVRNK